VKLLRALRSRRFWLWTAAVLVVLVAATVTSVEATSRSSFCNNCHIMGSYYDSWKTGSHRTIECVECHIAPGMDNFVTAKLNGLGQVVDDWLNRASTKPSASVSDFACTRSGCHVMEEVDTSDASERGYAFDHAKHLDHEYDGIAMGCTTCHSHVQGSRHFEVNTNTCVTCHLIRGETVPVLAGGRTSAPAAGRAAAPANCRACHEPPDHPIEYRGLTVDHDEYLSYGAACESCHRGVTAPPRRVTDAECLTCHDFGMERAAGVDEMHHIHSGRVHKVECFNCHGVTAHGPGAAAMSLGTFDCRNCHRGQHDPQRTTYLAPAAAHEPEPPTAVSPMFLVHVDCTGCHVKPGPVTDNPENGATVARAVPEACDACHRPGFGAQLIPLWQRSARELYDEVAALLPPEPATPQAREARRLLDLVRVDGSWGVHNPRYTQQLLEQARAMLLGAAAPPPQPPRPQETPGP
jgi:nitrate/TMAO reductase-like tetraheme cytochrome c subunit